MSNECPEPLRKSRAWCRKWVNDGIRRYMKEQKVTVMSKRELENDFVSKTDLQTKLEGQQRIIQEAHQAFHRLFPGLIHGVHDEHNIAAQIELIAEQFFIVQRRNADLKNYLRSQAVLEDKSAHEWAAEDGRLATAYRAGMWCAYHNVERFIGSPSETAGSVATRKEMCGHCGEYVSDWVDPDWANGRICKRCETLHEPSEIAKSKSLHPNAPTDSECVNCKNETKSLNNEPTDAKRSVR